MALTERQALSAYIFCFGKASFGAAHPSHIFIQPGFLCDNGHTLSYYHHQLFITPKAVDGNEHSLLAKCGIVTGSNVGLGYKTARQLLGLEPSKLILAVRNPERGEAVRKGLLSDYPNVEILVWEVDMSLERQHPEVHGPMQHLVPPGLRHTAC